MTTRARSANRIDRAAKTSAPPNVAMAGVNSRKPECTTTTDMTDTTTENSAKRRAQTARRETGSSRMRRRTMLSSRTNPFQGSPLGRIEHRPARGGRRQGIDHRHPLLGGGMVEQKLDLAVGLPEAREKRGERMCIGTDLRHQCDPIQVRAALDLARVGRLQHGFGGEHNRSPADEIAEQHA